MSKIKYSPILSYVLKRIVNFLILSFIVCTINFILPRCMPGSPLSGILARMSIEGASVSGGKAIVERYIKEFGLDKDLFTQYICYLRQLLTGNLGVSIMAFPDSVSSLIAEALPWTVGLLATSTILSWIIGNLLGTFVGFSKKKKINSILIIISLSLNRIPYYLLSIILIYLFAYVFTILPSSGRYGITVTPGLNLPFIMSAISHSILPALSIILVSVGAWLISMRSLTVSVLGEDYLLYAEAKGLKKRRIFMRYLFRNTLLPQVTSLSMSLGSIASGSLLLEQVYDYPGMGSLLFDAFEYRDYNVMHGIFLLTTIGVLGAVTIIDLLYPLIDPRIRYGGK